VPPSSGASRESAKDELDFAEPRGASIRTARADYHWNTVSIDVRRRPPLLLPATVAHNYSWLKSTQDEQPKTGDPVHVYSPSITRSISYRSSPSQEITEVRLSPSSTSITVLPL
jgi:hypothetical protein